jgi:hypothetical protein
MAFKEGDAVFRPARFKRPVDPGVVVREPNASRKANRGKE